MKIKGPIIDPNPTEPALELAVVTYRKTDLSREMIKGDVGTVVDVDARNPEFYSVEVNFHTVERLHRSEFRLATPEDLARSREALEKKEKRAQKNGTEMELRFRFPEYPGDPKI